MCDREREPSGHRYRVMLPENRVNALNQLPFREPMPITRAPISSAESSFRRSAKGVPQHLPMGLRECRGAKPPPARDLQTKSTMSLTPMCSTMSFGPIGLASPRQELVVKRCVFTRNERSLGRSSCSPSQPGKIPPRARRALSQAVWRVFGEACREPYLGRPETLNPRGLLAHG